MPGDPRLSVTFFNKLYLAVLLVPIALYAIFLLATQGSILSLANFSAEGSLSIALALLVLFVAHELIHAVIFWSGGVDWKNISLVMERSSLSLGIDISKQIPLKLWRASLLGPLLLLSAMLIAIGSQEGAHSTAWLLLAFTTSGCAYDIAVFLCLRGYPADMLVYPGFTVEEKRLALLQ